MQKWTITKIAKAGVSPAQKKLFGERRLHGCHMALTHRVAVQWQVVFYSRKTHGDHFKPAKCVKVIISRQHAPYTLS